MNWLKMGKRQLLNRIIMLFFSIFPIDNNKVVIRNYYGKGYGDSGKYISHELLKKDPNIKIIWLTNDFASVPKEIKPIRDESLKALYALSTSRIWIDNCRKSVYTHKRKRQLYIQTWHGPMGFKLCEKDSEETLGYEYIQNCIHDSKIVDYMTSGSAWNTDLIKRAFWYDGEILEIGTPRNDVFFRDNSILVNEIKKKFSCEKKRIILYAPTFRSSGDTSMYFLDFKMLRNAFETLFECPCAIWVRMHPNVSKKISINKDSDVIDVTSYPDMQELLITCDALLTDFSSSAFDVMLMKKPVFLIAKDYERFIKEERKMYFEIESLPFPFANDEHLLTYEILRFNEEDYADRIYGFCEKTGIVENGHASETLAEIIVNYIVKRGVVSI